MNSARSNLANDRDAEGWARRWPVLHSVEELNLSRRQILRSTIALLAVGCGSRQRTVDVPATEAWQRIHEWLSKNAPKIMANLNSPATETELREAEKKIGLEMPREWRELYRAHNGMNATANLGSLFFGMQFLSLDAVLRRHELSNIAGDDSLRVRAADKGIRKDDIYNPKWIPFAHDSGDTLLRVDMSPGPDGNMGQVIFTDHADDTVILLANSLTDFVWQFVEDLEAGRYSLDKDALEAGNQFLACDATIYLVNWHLTERWKHLK